MIGKKVLWAAVAGWSGKLVVLAIGFLLTPFILHRLGGTQYGLFVLVGTVIGQGALLDFGIGSAVVKYVAEHRARGENDRLSSLIATALIIYCCLGLLAMLLTVAIAPIFPHLFNIPASEHGTAIKVFVLMGIGLAISIPCATPRAILTGLQSFGLVNALAALGALMSAVATITSLAYGGGIVAMVAAGLAATLSVQALTFWCVRRVAPEIRFGWRAFRVELIRTVLSFSASMSVMGIAYTVQTRSDEIVIGAFLPVSSVGAYSVARRLSAVPQLVTEQALAAFLPLTSQLEAEGNLDPLRSLHLVGSRITIAICVSIAGVLIALGGPLLTLWVGAGFAQYAPIVIVLALACVTEMSHWPAQAILQGLARHHRLAVAYVVAALAKLVLAVLLVRTYGLIGIAFATLISAAALGFGYVFPYSMRVLGISLAELLKAVLPAFLAALPMMALLYGISSLLKPSGLLPVGSVALASLFAYAIVYISFCAGQPERQLLHSVLTGTMSALSSCRIQAYAGVLKSLLRAR